MKPAHLLFDLDGTLTDSRPGIIACFEYALERLGIPVEGDLSFCLGPPLHASFARLLKTDDPEQVKRAVELYRERFAPIGMFENSVYPGIPEMLSQLKERGHRMFVATSKVGHYARQIVTHFKLDGFFEVVYGSEFDGRLAKKGELIASILERQSLEPGRTWMIGDREHDIMGAKQNSLRAIGALWGYGSLQEFERAGADHIVESASHIIGLVSQPLDKELA